MDDGYPFIDDCSASGWFESDYHLELEFVLNNGDAEVWDPSLEANLAGKVVNLNSFDLEDDVELNTDTVEIVLHNKNNSKYVRGEANLL